MHLYVHMIIRVYVSVVYHPIIYYYWSVEITDLLSITVGQ